MPELPEVETVRRGLAPVMEGNTIAKALVNRPDLRWPFPERMAERLTGARVERLRRRSSGVGECSPICGIPESPSCSEQTARQDQCAQ